MSARFTVAIRADCHMMSMVQALLWELWLHAPHGRFTCCSAVPPYMRRCWLWLGSRDRLVIIAPRTDFKAQSSRPTIYVGGRLASLQLTLRLVVDGDRSLLRNEEARMAPQFRDLA